jgi:hypothetical protein
VSEPSWKNLQVPPTGRVLIEYPESDEDKAHRRRIDLIFIWSLLGCVLAVLLIGFGCILIGCYSTESSTRGHAWAFATGILPTSIGALVSALAGFAVGRR